MIEVAAAACVVALAGTYTMEPTILGLMQPGDVLPKEFMVSAAVPNQPAEAKSQQAKEQPKSKSQQAKFLGGRH